METDQSSRQLAIKKYSNRRFYDTTRSRHVTLREMHDLICEGYSLEITDSKSGEDITHLILTQILLERDAPKLSIFPADILHQIIRTQQQFLGSVVEQFFAQVLAAHKASQDQWSRFLRNTIGFGQPAASNPMEWTRSLLESMLPAHMKTAGRNSDHDDRDREIEELHDRVAELSRMVERLSGDRPTP